MDHFATEGVQLLIKSLLSLKDEADCAEFLEDLLTYKELDDISQRMLVAKKLSEQVVYSKIVESTGASTATISRVNRAYNYGNGSYKKILSRVTEENL